MLPPPRCPPQLTATPATSAWIRAPRDRALSRLSSSNAPAPAPGTKPAALALRGREAFSGSSLKRRQSTRMAGVYTTPEELDRLVEAMEVVVREGVG